MDPFLSAHANDEEVEGMLDRFKVRVVLLAFFFGFFFVFFVGVCAGLALHTHKQPPILQTTNPSP